MHHFTDCSYSLANLQTAPAPANSVRLDKICVEGRGISILVLKLHSWGVCLRARRIDHPLCANGDEIEQEEARVVGQVHIVVLAAAGVEAALVVLLEPAVQASTINENVLTVLNTETPRHGTRLRATGAARKVRIASELANGRAEGSRRCRRRLVVGAFGLDHAHEDATGVVNQILIEDIVLHCRAVHPHGISALNQSA